MRDELHFELFILLTFNCFKPLYLLLSMNVVAYLELSGKLGYKSDEIKK